MTVKSLGEEAFRMLLESAPDGVVVINDQGCIVYVNAQTERMFGYAGSELLARPVEMLMPFRLAAVHRVHVTRYAEQPRLRPMGTGLTLSGRRKDGTEFPVEISLSPLETESGHFFTGIIRDVTDRREAERARQLLERNLELEAAIRTKDRFLASMSHELRTPMNAIIGFTGTLLMKLPGPLTADQEWQLQTVQSSAHHLLSLINDLLDLAKIESGKVEVSREPVAIRAVVDEVIGTLLPAATGKGLTLEACVKADTVDTDRRALRQILLNLVGNAVKFTEQGGVRVSARVVDGVPAEGHVAVRFDVTDTGPGVRDEDKARVFGAFEQLDSTATHRHEGTGLGLHLSQKLAAMLGGWIELESAFGHGSTFSLVLPGSRA